MKIGLVCPYDWSFPGGVRTHVLGLSRALVSAGHQTSIMAPASSQEEGILSIGGSWGIPVNKSVARVNFGPSAARKVSTVIDDEGFDVVHLHEPAVPSLSLLALMTSPKSRYVATFHTSRAGSVGYAAFQFPLRHYLSRLRERIAVSSTAMTFAKKYFPGEFHLVPNGISGSRFWAARPLPELESLKPFVLFVGRSEPRKGFDVLLDGVGRARRDSDLRLVMTGDLPSGSPSWVTALGQVDDEKLPSLFRTADVYCAPSLERESFGLVLIEAMAAGAPVVASKIDGYTEAGGDAVAWFSPGDSGQLAERLIQITRDEELANRYKDRGRQRSKQYDWQALLPQISAIYEQAAA